VKDKFIGTLDVDGSEVMIREGDTLGACLMRANVLVMHLSRSGEPRGIYCGMGFCHECFVTVDGVPKVRACITQARPGTRVLTGSKLR